MQSINLFINLHHLMSILSYIEGQHRNEFKQHHLEQMQNLDANFQCTTLKQVRGGSLSIGEMQTKCKVQKTMKVAKTF